jgi:hypothetical protein
MVGLTGSVGENGKNARPDVALVQFMLAMARDSNGRPYYGTPYTGSYDAGTKLAIAAFLPTGVLGEGCSFGSLLLRRVSDCAHRPNPDRWQADLSGAAQFELRFGTRRIHSPLRPRRRHWIQRAALDQRQRRHISDGRLAS